MVPFLKKIRAVRRPRCAALVAAAGSASRMGGVNKLMLPLEGILVLVCTLNALQQAENVDEIIVATREEDLVEISQLCRTYGISKCIKVVRGGERRVHSVMLAALEASPDLIDKVVHAAANCGAAAPAVPVKDTVKTVRSDGAVEKTLEREALRAVQTPQVFEADLLKAALQAALEQNVPITDDCSAVERLGKVVYLVEGDEQNLKITTPTDMILAEALLRAREEGR